MRVFISFASEDRRTAEQIHLALLGAGFETFFDAENLPAGGDYNTRISAAVDRADLFIFLISPESVAEGSFARTELRFAREKWRHPAGRVLPVMVRRVDWGQLPSYLAAVTVLEPEGSIAPEVTRQVRHLAAALRWRKPAVAAVTGLITIAVIAIGIKSWSYRHNGFAAEPATTPVASDTKAAAAATPEVAATGGSTAPPTRITSAKDEAHYPQCPEISPNPIVARAASLDSLPPEFTVDGTRHLLLKRDGQPTAVAAANALGSLTARQIIVVHFTAGPARGAGGFFARPDAMVSAHVIIDRDGKVQQLVPFDFAARHAGRGSWQGIGQLNSKSLGIELENWGSLERRENGWTTYRGQTIPDEDVFEPADTQNVGWQLYTCDQLRSFLHVARALRKAYPSIEHMIGHSDITDSHKVDPGPAFPMARMRQLIFAVD